MTVNYSLLTDFLKARKGYLCNSGHASSLRLFWQIHSDTKADAHGLLERMIVIYNEFLSDIKVQVGESLSELFDQEVGCIQRSLYGLLQPKHLRKDFGLCKSRYNNGTLTRYSLCSLLVRIKTN